MWSLLDWCLTGWTALAAAWWITAWWLVRQRVHQDNRGALADPPGSPGAARLSIFKPIPALRGRPVGVFAEPVASFVQQLDAASELLLGIEEQDQPAWEPQLATWRTQYPAATIHAVFRPKPTGLVSPKVSWHQILSERAHDEWWLWSDADILIPPGYLSVIRAQFAAGAAALVTGPYVIRRVTVHPMLFETLFVNVEFFPGVLACERAGALRFALGAALLFRAADFRERVGWDRVSRLAEDYVMGRALSPVSLSRLTVETFASSTGWREALLHYLRWHKTVRWNRPGGFAGQLLILPVLGWLVTGHWAGLAVTVLLEGVVAVVLCRQVGCRLRLGQVLLVPLWSLARVITWIVCWLPLPVVFQSQQQVWWSVSRTAARGGER